LRLEEVARRCHTGGVLSVSGRASTLRCAYCHGPFAAHDRLVPCAGCGSVYHPDCLHHELSACASVGCSYALPRAAARLAARCGAALPRRPAHEGLGWTLVPWLVLSGTLFAMALATEGWVAHVMASFGALSLVLTTGWVLLVGTLVACGLAGRR
jgi:uncharacterized membrane protein YgdD (TMEM256/DUF423 family)